MHIQFGREICGNLRLAEQREWLVTNGIGGYACGTVAGLLTRHYHGLLVAALNPPVGRMLLLTKLDDTAIYCNRIYPLCANRWADGSVNPEGDRHIERFFLEGTTPVWQFAVADALITKRIWMTQGQNTTYIQYILERGSGSLMLHLRSLVNYRNHHGGSTLGNWQVEPHATETGKGVRITAYGGAVPFYIMLDRGSVAVEREWYHNFDLAVEQYRGTGTFEDHLHAATFKASLSVGESITVVASTAAQPLLDGMAARGDRHRYETALLHQWRTAHKLEETTAPGWIQQLVLAADQFIVDRPLPNEPVGKTVIAGYPWFGDWGRDTMISLPGLAIATGRPEIAPPILRTFARYLKQGMLPNMFPDEGEIPGYNTVDATLWYFEAIRAYHTATQDDRLLRELYPALADIIYWHKKGTRHQIHLDAADGLIYAGEAGLQLTWMDAKVEDWVVTPRIGKPIEVNALWYNALQCMVQFAQRLGYPGQEYEQMAQQTRQGFQRFWNDAEGHCYDVLDTPLGDDAALRPNQIFAVSLPFEQAYRQAPLLAIGRQTAVVQTVGRQLLTSFGLRSLAPGHPDYRGYYGGDRQERDGAYHQGTVWSWLIGPFVEAHLRVHQHPATARTFLLPFADQLQSGCVGTVSEIFDAEPPHAPRGAFAQAWSVAELLRAWLLTRDRPLIED